MSSNGISPRETQVRALRQEQVNKLLEGDSFEDGESEAAISLAYESVDLAGQLAALDFLLTGTACYGLTWEQRFDRVRALRESAGRVQEHEEG